MQEDGNSTTRWDWSDEYWLERLKEMDESAWNELISHFAGDLREDVRASVRKYGLPDSLIEDIEQDTWRTAIQKIEMFQSRSIIKLYHWIRVIACNKVRMTRRKQSREVVSLDGFEQEEDEKSVSLDWFLFVHGHHADSPEYESILSERVSALNSALREILSQRDCEILVRRIIDRTHCDELAQIYGVEPATVSQILYRAKKTLKRHLSAVELFRAESEGLGYE